MFFLLIYFFNSMLLATYSYESPVHCVPEIDGLRIISNTTHELLYRIPGYI